MCVSSASRVQCAFSSPLPLPCPDVFDGLQTVQPACMQLAASSYGKPERVHNHSRRSSTKRCMMSHTLIDASPANSIRSGAPTIGHQGLRMPATDSLGRGRDACRGLDLMESPTESATSTMTPREPGPLYLLLARCSGFTVGDTRTPLYYLCFVPSGQEHAQQLSVHVRSRCEIDL